MVEVDDVNETPVVSGDAAPSFPEIEFDIEDADLTDDDYEIGTYSATDDDGDPITWDVMGLDAGYFTISASGVLSFSIRPDRENPADGGGPAVRGDNFYNITVRAKDGQDAITGIGEYPVTVEVTAVDETPEITGGSDTPSFEEIEWDADMADLVVETFTARDEETEAITWGLGGDDMEDFTINSTTGVLSFASRPNYEISTDSSPHDHIYTIIVKATDAAPHRNTRELLVNVEVTDVDETPEVDGPMDDDDFPETIYTSFTTPDVATFTARDEEDKDITWNLSGDDAGDFTITGDAFATVGVVTFNNPPNHENPADDDGDNTYEFTVEAYDGTNTGTWDYAVTVTDVNETPEFTNDGTTATTFVAGRARRDS